MFKARRIDNNEIVEAEDLRVIENPKSIGFVCVDHFCNIPLIPSSYNETSKKRPFFKKYKNQSHSIGCSYGTFLRLIEIGRKRRLTAIEFQQLDYPSQLVVQSKLRMELNSKVDDQKVVQGETVVRTKSNGMFTDSAQSNRKVTTISQIVDFYLACPWNRDAELDLLGNIAPYKFQFRRIKGPNEGKYIENKIFYGILDLRDLDAIHQDDQFLYIKLHECEKWEEVSNRRFPTKKRINPYVLKLEKEKLSKYKMSRILKERDTVVKESKNDFSKKEKKNREAWVFFIGRKPILETPYQFDVVDGYISFRYAELKKTNEN